MQSLIDAHAAHLRLAAYRPATIHARVAVLRAFERTLEPHRTLVTADRLDVQGYLGRDLAPESRRAYLGHLRGWYRWAIDEGLVTEDPTAKLPAVRVPRGVPRPVSDSDLRKAVEQADPRMKAWLLLMALAGLRCLEVAALRPEDVSVTEDGPLLFLREVKGGGTGVVPAHPAIMAALLALPIRNRLWWDCTARHVSILVGGHLRAVGVSATAHQLRHSAGTEFYKASGYDLLTTAKLLRHASVQSSQIYSQVDAARPSQVIRAMRAPVGDAHAATRADTHGSDDLHRAM